jgi:hypothetical protein
VKATRGCSIEGCENPGRLHRGWCNMHYKRWLAHGDPLIVLKRGGQNRTHGMWETPEWRTWAHMKSRCLSPSSHAYADYGGRGITVYQPWIGSFEAFLAYMGPKPTPEHSIDRIDNDGNYEPGNVRWATAFEQIHNRRPRTHCVRGGHEFTPADTYIAPDGERQCRACNRQRERARYHRDTKHSGGECDCPDAELVYVRGGRNGRFAP